MFFVLNLINIKRIHNMSVLSHLWRNAVSNSNFLIPTEAFHCWLDVYCPLLTFLDVRCSNNILSFVNTSSSYSFKCLRTCCSKRGMFATINPYWWKLIVIADVICTHGMHYQYYFHNHEMYLFKIFTHMWKFIVLSYLISVDNGHGRLEFI